ncbi:MAG TPA: hypothetical protein VK436_10400 [Methanocella sp.]|nr:hypothetical protein [Methanocella sp.]
MSGEDQGSTHEPGASAHSDHPNDSICVFRLDSMRSCYGPGHGITTLPNALLIHAAAAPLIFGIVTATYYRKPGYSPFHTAIVFTCFVIVTDFCW